MQDFDAERCQYTILLEKIKFYGAIVKIQDEEMKQQRLLYEEEVVSDFPTIIIIHTVLLYKNYF